MFDVTKEQLEKSRPYSGVEAVGYCLNKLFEDQSHSLSDYVSPGLTYEEVVGALLCAQDGLSE